MSKLKGSLEALRKSYRAFQAPVVKGNSPLSPSSHDQAPVVFTYGDERKAAQVFGTKTCSFTHRALNLLESAAIETTFVNLGEPGAGAIRRELTAETDHHTVPYVYLRGKFIGGFRELDRLYRSGELKDRSGALEGTAGTRLATEPGDGEVEPGQEDT